MVNFVKKISLRNKIIGCFTAMSKNQSRFDTLCAHCSATCKGKIGVSLHFLSDHLLNYWHSNTFPCPFCDSNDSSLMHIFMQHRSACLLCLKDVSAGAHTECHESVVKAAEEMARNVVIMQLFSSRESVLP